MTGPAVPPRIWDFYDAYGPPARPPAWLGGAGGVSGSNLWRIEAASGPLMLRRWPADGPGPARLDQIHRWLDRAHAWPVVALPLAGRDGSTWWAGDSGRWELSRFLPGIADLGRPPTPPHLATMFATLARFHALFPATAGRGPSPGLLARAAELDGLLKGEYAAIGRALDRSGGGEEARLAWAWFEMATTESSRVVGPLRAATGRAVDRRVCLRDVRPDHFLFEGDRLTGLVDFGAMDLDAVETDLARLLGETVGRDPSPRAAALEAYESSRPPGGPIRPDLLEVFEAANAVLGGARWARWHFLESRRFPPGAVAAGLARACRRLVDFTTRR